MLNKNIQKMKLRKNKRVKDEKKAAERERMLPRNRQVQNYYMTNIKKTLAYRFIIIGNRIIAPQQNQNHDP